jgi:hypothetical protein
MQKGRQTAGLSAGFSFFALLKATQLASILQ